MKKFIFCATALLFVVTGYAKEVCEVVVSTTPKMTCANCVKKIKENVRFGKGIQNLEINAKNQKIKITYDSDKTDLDNIKKEFERINYQITILDADNSQQENGK